MMKQSYGALKVKNCVAVRKTSEGVIRERNDVRATVSHVPKHGSDEIGNESEGIANEARVILDASKRTTNEKAGVMRIDHLHARRIGVSSSQAIMAVALLSEIRSCGPAMSHPEQQHDRSLLLWKVHVWDLWHGEVSLERCLQRPLTRTKTCMFTKHQI